MAFQRTRKVAESKKPENYKKRARKVLSCRVECSSSVMTGEMDQLNRPRTRGLEASEAEEDAKLVRAALKEPLMYIKKAHQKLKKDYGGDGEESDEEEKLFYQQPPFDDDESDVKSGTKRKRGGRRGNAKRKQKTVGQDGEEEVRKHTVSARLAAMLKEEMKPRIAPYNGSAIEFKQVWYKIGDIVSIQKEDNKYFVQILSFHTDQFCGRYASVQWLLPRYKMDHNDPHQPPVTTESFRGSVPEETPMNMDCFQFVLRPPAHYFQSNNPNTINRGRYYTYQNDKRYFDSPSPTLTSVERRY